jgi:hypothetical protein
MKPTDPIRIAVPLRAAVEFVALVYAYSDTLRGSVEGADYGFDPVDKVCQLLMAALPFEVFSEEYYQLLDQIRSERGGS